MRAGNLVYSLVIERDRNESEVLDAYGSIVAKPVIETRMRAQLMEDALDEAAHASGAVQKRVLKFKIRFLDDLRSGDTLLFEGTRYEILTIRQLGRRSAIELTARESKS
jgi:SPP1 family predicted phage head-tail adaptor